MSEILVSAVELDTSIQCRAAIDTGIVNEYAERMIEGDRFPAVEVYGTRDRCWIADGWHRVLAAKQIGVVKIDAVLHEGGRAEALRHALGANAHHGHRRTNADKRRAVEIALREYPHLSSRQIAEMCGVSHMTVQRAMPDALEQSANAPATVTTSDGRQYPARRQTDPPQPKELPRQEPQEEKPYPVLQPPCVGMQFARIAIMKLSEIRENDLEREQAFQAVERWLREHA